MVSVGATGTASTSSGLAQPRGAQCRTDRCAGCDAVIDDDGGASRDIDALTIAKIARAAALDFGKLAIAHGLEFGLAHVGERDDVFIAHDQWRATIDNRAHCQLRLLRDADLAHENEIERRGKSRCNFGWQLSRRRAAARE
jgi:hypothetical protein